ncbi:transmembrane protein 230-like [Coffea eugenioides]|uniref:transmembrane protein 230-like n=1 Tax=Coffea eugenioides TaxID=49369 RepID=UPI000F61118E|nr:transmembrane protein 230-like [Coffea eugenioides]
MASRRNTQYTRLPTYDDEDDDYDGSGRRRNDPRYDFSPKSYDKIPWKSITLAVFLLFLGCLLLLLSFFIFTGHMGGDTSQAYGLLGLGLLTFLPGFYETRIAYYAWRGAQGYRFGSIPDY